MVLILIGLLLILVQFNLPLTINEVVFNLDIFPNLIGFILLLIGFSKLSNRVEAFAKGRAYVLIGLVLSILEYLPIIKGNNFFTSVLVPALVLGFSLVVLNYVNKGVNELELKTGQDLGGVKFLGLFNIQVVAAIILVVASLIPNSFILLLGSLANLTFLVLAVVYLIYFSRAIKKVD